MAANRKWLSGIAVSYESCETDEGPDKSVQDRNKECGHLQFRRGPSQKVWRVIPQRRISGSDREQTSRLAWLSLQYN